jgi:TonB-dependent SusC/RagA subfamily outer membrane receptor
VIHGDAVSLVEPYLGSRVIKHTGGGAMPTTGIHTMYTLRALGATVLIAGSACSAHAPPVTDDAPITADAKPKTSTSSDATLTQTGAPVQQYSRIEELIASRAPGVQVVQVNGAYAFRIRGLSSPSGINDPLIVVDGVVSNLPGTRGLDGISPNDVLRVEVLKDAASTAYYGMRGASGVILVTTRKK